MSRFKFRVIKWALKQWKKMRLQEMNKEHIGSNFDDFLKEEGILEETEKKVKEEMNKPIIIDGVDVSGCVHFFEEGNECDLGGECDGWNNCYYKQIQRLKEENERLKAPSMIIPQVGKLGVPIEQYCKLKQALEEVREIAYTTDFDIADIQKICNEVLKDE